MYIFHDESGVFAPSSQPGSFSVVAAYILSAPQYRAAKEVLLRHKLRNGWPINAEFKRVELKGKEEPYFRFLEELAPIGGILVAVGSDVSGNTGITDYQQDYANGLLLELDRTTKADEQARIRKQAEDIRTLPEQQFTELACRVRLGWEVLQRATGYYAQRYPGALRRREWHYDPKDKHSPFDALLKGTIQPLMARHAFVDPLQLIRHANYKHLGDAFVIAPDGLCIRPKKLVGSIQFPDSISSEGVQLVDLLANGLFGVLRNRFKDRERAATLLGRLMVHRAGTLLLPTMNYSHTISRRTPEIESIMLTMHAASRALIKPGSPIRTTGDAVV
jgi:hypothetical protein